MPNLKFHLVTVIGIFLALALGIVIGSTFTEDSIILQQRNTIDQMKESLEGLSRERLRLQAERRIQAETLSLLQDWLGALTPLYLEANPIPERAVLLYAQDFEPGQLGDFFNERVIRTRLQLAALEGDAVSLLVQALVQGEEELLSELGEALVVEGDFVRPDYVLLAPGARGDWAQAGALAQGLLNAEVPVIALGSGGADWADLAPNPLFASVSHPDTPLALICLEAIFLGQGGHYGTEILLPQPPAR
jgi:hypothetical protein